MQKARLERCWDVLKPEILRHWDKLSEHDLQGIDGRFDRLVSVIRKQYAPTRLTLSIEAEIRDWVIGRVGEQEDREAL